MRTARAYRWNGIFLVALGLGFVGTALVLAVRLIESRARYARVEGIVTAREIRTYPGASPDVPGDCRHTFRWEYEFEGQRYESQTWNQVPRQNSCADLAEAFAGLAVGDPVRGYHDRRGVAPPFLYPRRDTELPYTAIVGGLVVLVGIHLLGIGRRMREDGALRRYGNWYRIQPLYSHGRFSTLLGLGTLWTWACVAASAVLYSQFSLAAVPHRELGLLGVVGGGMLATVWFVAGARARTYDEPVLAIDQPQLRRGQAVTVRITQKFLAPVRVLALEVGVECRYYRYSRRSRDEVTIARARETVPVDREVGGGSQLEQTITITVPDDPKIDEYAHLKPYWYIAYRCDSAGVLDTDWLCRVPGELDKGTRV